MLTSWTSSKRRVTLVTFRAWFFATVFTMAFGILRSTGGGGNEEIFQCNISPPWCIGDSTQPKHSDLREGHPSDQLRPHATLAARVLRASHKTKHTLKAFQSK